MTATRFDVIGIGNAIVDVITHADDDFLKVEGLEKGAMTIVEAKQLIALYDRIKPTVECSGGSAANTIAGLASLGGRGAFIGKVRDDHLGDIFRHDIRATGVTFDTPPATTGPQTATSLILVSPDAQRTMQTFLGACVGLGSDDIDEDAITAAEVTYLEGYLWDPPEAKKACIKAAEIAHAAGREVSLSLSDPLCVDRHRADFLDLARNRIDILFANEEEIKSLYQVDDFDQALQVVQEHSRVAALTRGEKGSVIVLGDEIYVVNADPVDCVVDTTGAGDAFAAGFLFGLTNGANLAAAARIGNVAAAEVISKLGARPMSRSST